MCLKTNIDKRIHNFGFQLYAVNLNDAFFHKYSTSSMYVVKILAEFVLNVITFKPVNIIVFALFISLKESKKILLLGYEL